MIATFIRLSAASIQIYLETKNEPTKSSEDRIQEDMILVKNCEKWVTDSYLLLFQNLKIISDSTLKQSLFAALSQLCGALEESSREGNLNIEHINSILASLYTYVVKNYSLS
jgi:hypothetical protein